MVDVPGMGPSVYRVIIPSEPSHTDAVVVATRECVTVVETYSVKEVE